MPPSQTLYERLRLALSRQLALQKGQEQFSEEDWKRQIAKVVDEECLALQLPLSQREHWMQRLYHSIRGLDILQPLMEDKSISEIMVNSYQDIFIEREGKLEAVDLRFDSQEHLDQMVRGLFSRENKELSLRRPIGDLRLQDGSRANAVLAPIASRGPVLTIRKFSNLRPSPETLLQNGSLSREALDFLAQAVRQKKSIFLCGGTGSGKTTLLNILSHFIPPSERIITIEDSAELQLQDLPNLVSLEARAPTVEGKAEISLALLLKTALRMRPDRIIVGEVRGEEAYLLLHAANTGHPGTLSTGHANSCHDMLKRLSNMILEATSLPYEAILHSLMTCIDLLVYLQRLPNGQRRVMEIAQPAKLVAGNLEIQTLFSYDPASDRLLPCSETETKRKPQKEKESS